MKTIEEVQELCTKCLESRYVKRSQSKLIIEQLFTQPNSEQDKLLQQAIDELQKRIDSKERKISYRGCVLEFHSYEILTKDGGVKIAVEWASYNYSKKPRRLRALGDTFEEITRNIDNYLKACGV